MIAPATKPLKRAAIWFCGYPSLLAMESLWVGVASRWIESARQYAGPDPMRHMFTTGSGALVGFAVAWFLSRGARWAYLVACVWAAVSGGGIVAWILLMLGTSFRRAPGGPFVASVGVVLSAILITGSLLQLFRKETRGYFARR